ncbi:MAG: helix-turn-helix domain-containing protein [Bacilli bacterium]|nr:helix-turn-helix domain-containing protein [Bacilli bacterium]
MIKRNSSEYLKMLGSRIKQYRVKIGLSQSDIESKTGLSVRTISRFEQGASIQFEAFIKILIALNLSENLNLLVEDQTDRPSYYLLKSPSPNTRARKKAFKTGEFVWGEDK